MFYTSRYNDAYIEVSETRHPAILGQPFSVAWADIWDQLKDVIRDAMAGKSGYMFGTITSDGFSRRDDELERARAHPVAPRKWTLARIVSASPTLLPHQAIP